MNNNILTPIYNYNGIFLRQIRSFVCRKGRITRSQLSAIQKYWSLIGIDFQLRPLNFLSIFNRDAPVVLEIGFGSGESLVKTAMNFPNKNFLGIEVYKSGIGSCLHSAYSYKIKNLRIIYYDAIEVIHNMIMNNSLSSIQIFFPDPWNKKRHHKRRLLQKNFLKIISKKLIIGGTLHIATDSESYAFYILDEIKNIENYKNLSQKNCFIERPISRIITKFERKGFLRGNKIFDLMFKIKK
ncbi:tRNA (guanosine(46)-N7)-methyltransferase TrmB [Buchnera aphidicola (Acyrthosiphon lactucae)]|uniref:tRNA (guanine-N(7)-)-methyltransferase n=1 Tax=Buchnera aphidicola (Acyrthosiphon lactucae) TaxID=1241832 RepID=A0A4D6XSV0_9GAMM|nr:tRNA (guanosine(46)-N7)-methyltransferase TrmB [Buchnera aphidicola]QCI17924.1 tRNA (guanosine(46)-N7)-methyltransferase TrmB [Buchnera aphidicola (Acyrthosiphon lactucae)]